VYSGLRIWYRVLISTGIARAESAYTIVNLHVEVEVLVEPNVMRYTTFGEAGIEARHANLSKDPSMIASFLFTSLINHRITTLSPPHPPSQMEILAFLKAKWDHREKFKGRNGNHQVSSIRNGELLLII
jgi:hypothetical protein